MRGFDASNISRRSIIVQTQKARRVRPHFAEALTPVVSFVANLNYSQLIVSKRYNFVSRSEILRLIQFVQRIHIHEI